MTTSAFTPLRILQNSGLKPEALNTSGNLHVMHDTYTAAAAAGSTGGALYIDFPRLLAGKVVIYPHLSYLRSDDMSANADLHLGHRAYTDSTQTVIPEDDNEWLDNVDSGGGAIAAAISAVTGFVAGTQGFEYDAQGGLRIFITIDTGDMDAGDVIELMIVYSHNPS